VAEHRLPQTKVAVGTGLLVLEMVLAEQPIQAVAVALLETILSLVVLAVPAALALSS
jgi:hypothetical protein